jgi:hypothetical protein
MSALVDEEKAAVAKAKEQSEGRAAYGDAMALLRENHRDEFDGLLDAAYESRGLVSPRKRRAEKAAAAAAAKEAAVLARAERAAAKVERLKAELAAAEAAIASAPVVEADPGDPIF